MPKRRDLHLYEKKNYDQIKYSFEICFSILSSLLLWQKLWELFDKNKQFDTCHIIFYWNRILHLIFTQPILKKIEIVEYCMFSFGYF